MAGFRRRHRLIGGGAATALLVAVALASCGGESKSGGHTSGLTPRHRPTPPPSGPLLQVIDAVPVNEPPHAKALEKYDAADSEGVVLTLKNAGSDTAVINRAEVDVQQFAALDDSGCIPGAGPIPISANYQVTLPANKRPDAPIPANVSQQVKPHAADRMRIGFALDDSKHSFVYVNSNGVGTSRLYQLDIKLFHDGLDTPTPAGSVVLAIPFPWYGLFIKAPGLAGSCVSQNVDTLREALSWSGTHSPELEAFAKDPEASACAIKDPTYCAKGP